MGTLNVYDLDLNVQGFYAFPRCALAGALRIHEHISFFALSTIACLSRRRSRVRVPSAPQVGGPRGHLMDPYFLQPSATHRHHERPSSAASTKAGMRTVCAKSWSTNWLGQRTVTCS